ncbi:MAG: ABC transporter permease subunit, partial [Methanobacteriota archaeon]
NFTVSLNVTDDDGHWDTDVVSVAVVPDTEPPVARGGNRTAPVGILVTLNATLSTDNARIVNYTWEFEYDDQDYALYGEVVQFWFNRSGTYEILLTVTDASGLTNSTTVMVQVVEEPTWLSQNWLKLMIAALLLAGPSWLILAKYRKDRALITKSDIEKLHLQLKNLRKLWKQFRTRLGAMFGLYLLLFFIIAALFAPWLGTEENPNDIGWARVREQYLPPSLDNLFGTDFYGRDVYSLTIYGARASLIVGILASLISIILGTVVGVAAGYFGKVSDEILMRVTDFFLVLPWFPLMIVIASLLGRSFTNVIIVIGITSWPSTARIVRAQVMSVKEMGFIERARSIGCRDGHIIQKHVLPNVFPLIFANTILLIANSIFSEAFLDFFGLGDPNVISWGVMLEEAYQYGAFTSFAWWWILAPGSCIVLLIMSFYLIGDALDEIFNPRLRKR